MTLAEQLGYQHRHPNLFQRGMRRFAYTRLGAWIFSKTLRYADAALARVVEGHTVPEYLAGLRSVFVTTTGAKTGQKRTSPLVAVPFGDALALVGTNFGQAKTPSWYHNLRVHPEAVVRYHDRVVPVKAHEVDGSERDQILQAARRIYAGYAAYETRITDRRVRVMLLQFDPDKRS